jgi:hypothetical protein
VERDNLDEKRRRHSECEAAAGSEAMIVAVTLSAELVAKALALTCSNPRPPAASLFVHHADLKS